MNFDTFGVHWKLVAGRLPRKAYIGRAQLCGRKMCVYSGLLIQIEFKVAVLEDDVIAEMNCSVFEELRGRIVKESLSMEP